MYIRCWGSRGSISVSGREYIKYGGSTTCMEIRSKKGDLIVIDAGAGIRTLGNQLMQEHVSSIEMLFTHAHWDHLMGFPFFKPIFNSGINISIRGCSFSKSSMKPIINRLMSRPYFPVQLSDKDIRANLIFRKLSKKPFAIGSITIQTIPLSHPKDGGIGYRFEEDGKSFVFLTDNELGYVHKGGCTFEEYCAFGAGADLLIHDSEFEDKEYQTILKASEAPWGHSVVSDVVRLGICADVKRLGLFHHNAMRNDDQVDDMVVRAASLMARKKKKIPCFAVGSSFEITL